MKHILFGLKSTGALVALIAWLQVWSLISDHAPAGILRVAFLLAYLAASGALVSFVVDQVSARVRDKELDRICGPETQRSRVYDSRPKPTL